MLTRDKSQADSPETAKELEAYTGLPEPAKQVVLALSIVIDRIGSLPKADREDMFELLKEFQKNDDVDERRSIQRAMEEILAQTPVFVRSMPLAEEQPMRRGLKKWATYVGRKIRQLREEAGLSQTQLAEKAGLIQSHICRIERANHSPTNFTLQKIAKALGVDVGAIDPCLD